MSKYSELGYKLYQNRNETGDVTFIVELEEIRAHRCVLAAFSPKYKAQLYDTELEKKNIEIEDITADAFKEFLQFFYSNEVKLTMENIGAVLDLAKQSLVDEFYTECVDLLRQNVKMNSLCSIYQLAILHDINDLREKCEQKMNINAKELFATEDFIHCHPDVLVYILKMNSLSCKEADLFDACISWARTACKEKDIDAKNPANLRAQLSDDVIAQIRFGSLTLEEFVARDNALKGFFAPDEFKEIMYMIGKLEKFKSQKFNNTPRQPGRNYWNYFARSEDEASNGSDSTSDESTVNCKHLKTAVNIQNVRKVFKKSKKPTFEYGKCTECVKTSKANAGDYEYDRSLWLCLKCGTHLCGWRVNKHALKHYLQTLRSESHAITLNTTTGKVRCYECRSYVSNIDSSVQKCIDFVNGDDASSDA